MRTRARAQLDTDRQGLLSLRILWRRRRYASRAPRKAQYNLGEWYANGECGLKKSRRLALKWLKMSAGNGNILAREVAKAVVFRRGPSSTLAV